MDESTEKKPYVYIITSCKGGIGKSTVTANLADGLCRRGKKVLCIDVDYSNRCLDLIFGCVNRVCSGITELVNEEASISRTVIDVNGKGLFFIPGPVGPVRYDPDKFSAAVLAAAAETGCDTVIIDTPGASDGILPEVCPMADEGIVVASHMPTAVRGAEKTGETLETLGLEKRHLVINRFDAAEVIKGERAGVNELIDGTCLMLLGVIPQSTDLEMAQENGMLASGMKHDRHKVLAAFEELSARLCGENIPLMSFYPRLLRRKLIDPRRKKSKHAGSKL